MGKKEYQGMCGSGILKLDHVLQSEPVRESATYFLCNSVIGQNIAILKRLSLQYHELHVIILLR